VGKLGSKRGSAKSLLLTGAQTPILPILSIPPTIKNTNVGVFRGTFGLLLMGYREALAA
jgi:hypothetical protein